MKLGRSEERGCGTVRELRHVDLAKVASVSWADEVSNKGYSPGWEKNNKFSTSLGVGTGDGEDTH